jgi:MFS family permease
MTTKTPQETSTTGKPWLILSFLAIPVFVGSLDLTIISAILPEVINQLDLSVTTRLDDASWMVSGYLLAYTISMLFTGRLSDLIGRRNVFVACLLLFMFGSWFVTIAHTWPTDWYLKVYRWIYPNPDTHIPPLLEIRQLRMIIVGRVIQAFGAGAMAPVAMAVVSDLYPATKRARPLGFVGAVDTVGWILGHLYGGAMVKFFGEYGNSIVDLFASIGIEIGKPDWRTLFTLNIPLSLIALAGVWWGLRGTQLTTQRKGLRFDILGTLLIILCLITLTIGIGGASPESAFSADSFDTVSGDGGQNAALLLGIASIAFVLFVFWEFRTKHPLLDLTLFKRRNYSASAFTNFCVGICLAIGLVGVPLVVNLRSTSTSSEAFQTAAFIAGLVLSGLTVPMALAAIPGGWLSDRYGFRNVTVLGMALSVVGFVISGFTWTSTLSYWIMGFEAAVIGIGLGLTISPVSTALINEVKMDERGVSAALVLVLRLVGMTVAIAGLTTYALYRVDQRLQDMVGLQDVNARNEAYLTASIDQINELFFIGAAISFVALLIALRLQGGHVQSDVQDYAYPLQSPTDEPSALEVN